MPGRSNRLLEASENENPKETGKLGYVSKSRVKQWLQNPRHFKFKYIDGLKPEETDAMVRGSRIHETFERFYLAEQEHGSVVFKDTAEHLPEERRLWADFLEPYVTNFLRWEQNRYEYALTQGVDWEPVGIEEEMWHEPMLGIEHEPYWMGLADVILPAASLPEIPADEGVVVVDFKTGSTPREQYRDEGIYTELEYYAMLFDEEYDVRGAAAYYPRQDDLVVQPDDEQHRANVCNAVIDMVEAVASGDEEDFPLNEGPLCGWSTEDDCRSDYYGLCSECHWNVPVDNRERFEKLCEKGLDNFSIAFKLGCKPDAVRYWRRKLNV